MDILVGGAGGFFVQKKRQIASFILIYDSMNFLHGAHSFPRVQRHLGA